MTKKEEKDNVNPNVSPKKEKKRKEYNLRKKRKNKYSRKRKSNESSEDSDSSSDYDPINDGEDEMDQVEFQKFIQKLFPSKNQREKVKQMEKIENMLKKDKKKKNSIKEKKYEENKKISVSDTEQEVENKKIKPKVNKSKKKKDKYKEKQCVSESESEYSYSEEFEFPEEEEELDDDEIQEMLKNNMKFNIVFTVGDGRGEEYDDYEYDEYLYDDYEEMDLDDDYTDDEMDEEEEKAIKKEEKKLIKDGTIHKTKFSKNEKVKVKLTDWDKFYSGRVIKVHPNKTKRLIRYDIKLDNNEYETLKKVKSKFMKKIENQQESDSEDYDNTLKELEKLVNTKKNKGREAMVKQFKKLVDVKEKKMKKKEQKENKKQKEKNVLKFKKLLRQRNTMNDYKYFKTLTLCEQKKILSQLKEVSEYNKVDVPHKLSLLECDIPVEYKSVALKKINTLAYMDPGAGEYYKTKQWVDTFLRIPFNKYNSLPVSIKDGPERVNEFMEKAKSTLDNCCYGLEDAKMQIMQIVGQWISNPGSVGNAIALKGPPGTGKTTLIKEGVSKILNRPFVFIPLGGATDSSYLEGHSYTYEGSTWGKIVDALITYKSMNPVFYFDELDKVSQTPKGEEIVGILTHLTDTTQNDKFHDKYFSNIDFDLNKCLFIFSYNDESRINDILKNRMYRIFTKGYSNEEKKIICKKYLIPKIEKNVNFKPEQIIIPDETIDYINSSLIEKEEGVRNVKRAMEIIFTKLNLHRLMKKGSTLFDKRETLNIKFPFTVSKEIVEKLVKKNETNNIPFGMYM